MDISHAAAYQRLLGELRKRLGATYAELLHADSHEPARVVMCSGGAACEEPAARWMELPISVFGREVGLLRMAFEAAAALPGPTERAPAHALAELAALLIGDDRQISWEAPSQAGQGIPAVTGNELQRIILDIHDGPVQKLFVVSSHLALLQGQLADFPPDLRGELAPVLDRLASLVETALQELRAALGTFRPAEFQRRSLPEVIQGLALQHQALTGNQVDLQIDGTIPSVSVPIKIALYRVLQEALANSFRHAGVDRNEVRLSAHAGWVMLEVSDRGRGFVPPLPDRSGPAEREDHIGLQGMRERIHLVGGRLRVASQPGQGTHVIAQVPSDA